MARHKFRFGGKDVAEWLTPLLLVGILILAVLIYRKVNKEDYTSTCAPSQRLPTGFDGGQCYTPGKDCCPVQDGADVWPSKCIKATGGPRCFTNKDYCLNAGGNASDCGALASPRPFDLSK